MELENALWQIDQIRRQMARTCLFRGYRAITTFCTGLLAIGVAVFQSWWIPQPMDHSFQYVHLWGYVAVVSLGAIGTEMTLRYRRCDSSLQRELTLSAVEQLLPCIIVGGLVTFLLERFAASALWMMPGLWTIFFGLGIFASRRLLPGALVYVGAFYLGCGLVYLAIAPGGGALSPWAMGLPFGLGQMGAAAVLHWNLERHHEPK